ncbi:Wzz/FepE/Etk N-terminal domain-containing protein [Actinomadura sp. ATCC 31491]|uniref:Wzz/FepE/Etk N-terminal domain-containing protein n=1 Tax=Actinomadura luzonensis TaxID=2805427 RepID=A0ABT0FM00_9ACTN|nr:Wzz/FepE/Etk N-terminal domain-containing protein [Actinomadura luzonensis]MCK2213213.1 Wzz/FepE/Etk N-terminal domain-containing protein [Actinomadura luzonensis]
MTQPPDVQARRPGAELEDHLSLLRRRWLILVGCVVVGGTAGLALLRLTPPAYTAATQVQVMPVGPQDPGNQVTARQREPLNLDTEAQVAASAVVAARAARALGGVAPAPAEVTVPPNSAVLSIAVTAADPRLAAAQSGAYADAYLAHRRESALAALTDQQQAVLGKLKQVNAGLDAAFRQLGRLRKGSAERAIALQRQSVLSRQAASLALKYDALRTVAVTPGAIISRAAPPAAPSSPSLPLHLGTGLMAGLLTGSAAAYARDRLDTRLRRAADVERLTGLPVLADLSGAREPGVLHELACAVVAACPGKRLLVRALPADLYASSLAEPLAVSAPLAVLDGTDVRDLARADAALLLVGLGRVTAPQVAAAARHLGRQDIPVIGVVTATDAMPEFVPLLEPRPHSPLGKLVATGEFPVPGELAAGDFAGAGGAAAGAEGFGVSLSAETTPMQPLRRPRPGRPT